MHSMKRLAFGAGLMALTATMSSAAYAQETGTNTAADAAQEASQQADSSGNEIIVTATRREESLQKVPVAVTAVGGHRR